MRKTYLSKNQAFSHHVTETDPRVIAYIERVFGGKAVTVEVPRSGDIVIEGNIIEIKSCSERIKRGKHSETGKPSTERGRFHFRGYESAANYILFILVSPSGEYMFRLTDNTEANKLTKGRLGSSFTINHVHIFGSVGG